MQKAFRYSITIAVVSFLGQQVLPKPHLSIKSQDRLGRYLLIKASANMEKTE